jgi:S-DNA-T family DNA segregation ATPase FtsK/SpoIIIE
LHLHDPLDAGVLGVAARHVPPAMPGRLFAAEVGLAAQLAAPGGTPLYDVTTGDIAPPIDATPPRVDDDTLPPAHHADSTTYMPVGVALADGGPALLEVPDGDHVLVLGGARSGRSTALVRLAHGWRDAHPDGTVLAVLPRRSAFPHGLADEVVSRLGTVPTTALRPLLIVVDDAELVDDPNGALAALVTSGRADCTMFAAARPDALRQAYGHWTGVLRRSRLGLVSAGGSDLDGDLLGATLPRRLPVPTRQGLMWMVAQGSTSLVQVAIPGATTTPVAAAEPDEIARPVRRRAAR